MRRILYVRKGESIVSVIDRLEHTEGETVYIAVDENPSLFSDPVNLKILKREAAALVRQAVLLTLSGSVLAAARTAGVDTLEMSTKEFEEEARLSESADEHAPAPRLEEIEVPPDQDETPDGFFRRKEKLPYDDAETHKGIAFSWRFILMSFVVAGLVAWAVFWFLSPRLKVVIIPKKETVRFDFQVVADSKISAVDVAKSRIPGQLIKLEKEVEGEFVASGKQDNETKAEGELTVYNEFSSVAQALVRNTRFEAKDGKIFRLKSAVMVPGAAVSGGKVSAPGTVTDLVIADQAGDAYNIGPSDFTIPGFAGTPKFEKFYAKSSKPMAGGGSGGRFMVTAEDAEKARTALSEKFASQAQEYVNVNVPKGSVARPSAQTQGVPEFIYDAPNTEGKFKARLKIPFEIFVFQESDIHTLAEQQLSVRLMETQRTVPGTRVLDYTGETLNTGKTTLNFVVKVNELTQGDVNEEEIAELLAGKGEQEIRDALKGKEAIESAEVTFSPFWISVAPSNPRRITINVE